MLIPCILPTADISSYDLLLKDSPVIFTFSEGIGAQLKTFSTMIKAQEAKNWSIVEFVSEV